MMKKILLFLLLLSALPIAQLQAQTYTHTANGKIWRYTLSGGNATITGARNLDNTAATGELNIPSQIGAAKVTAIGDDAFYRNYGITSLIFPASITIIGNDAFRECTGLIGNLDLQKVTTIGHRAFSECTKLTGELDLSNVTTIGIGAFSLCRGLTSLKSLKVTNIARAAFSSCSGLTGKLELPNTLTTIGDYAFQSCTGLTGKLELPKTLTSIGSRAFYSCDNLTAVVFGNGTALTNAGEHAFSYCDKLLYIDMTGVTSFPTGFTISRTYRNSSFFYAVQPYIIVYLPSSAPAAQSGERNFVIGNTCDRFTVYDYFSNYEDGCDYHIQHSFTATIAEYYSRSFSGKTCKTLCLPYPTTLPAGMTAYTLTRKRANNKFEFTSVAKAADGTTSIEANTPYLIRLKNENRLYFLNAESNVFVPVTPTVIETQAADGSGFYFGGTTTNIDNATAASYNYYNLENNTWRPISTSQPNGYVHSFRAYIRTTGGAPAKGFAMVLDDDDKTTTDIDNVAELTEDELKSGKHTFYTLDGRRVGTNYDTLKSGEMYVVKGQKFYKF